MNYFQQLAALARKYLYGVQSRGSAPGSGTITRRVQGPTQPNDPNVARMNNLFMSGDRARKNIQARMEAFNRKRDAQASDVNVPVVSKSFTRTQ